MKPLLAVTMGDPAGVGAEVVVKTLSRPNVYVNAQPFVIGDAVCLQQAMKQTGVEIEISPRTSMSEITAQSDVLQVLQPVEFDSDRLVMGEIDPENGRAAVQFFETAIEQAMAGEIQGIVTCPINKEAVQAAGYHGDIGHQEILARMTGSTLTATMLMTKSLKVAHLSTHKSLADAVRYVKTPILVEKLRLTADHLRRWTGTEPRIAVAALNPHGGEHGMLGNEEQDEIQPAVEKACELGLDVVGPYSADSVFYRAVAGEFDAVMALYHDQGHIAIKMHNFADSITATMGIPFVRTSVDHGTAFDIAGKNLANAEGLAQALDAAIMMINGTLV